MRYSVVDIETEILIRHERVAHFKYNEIVAMCFKQHKNAAKVYYKADNWEEVLKKELEGIDIIVAFNAKFECLYFWKYKVFQDWLLKGGKIYCPQLADYMLSGQVNTYPKLRNVEQKYGIEERRKHIDDLLLNRSPKKLRKLKMTEDQHIDSILPFYKGFAKEEIKRYNKMSDIPMEYVCTDVVNDVEGTEIVMINQVKEAKKEGMFTLIMEMMEGLLGTTEEEYNGIFINQKIKEKNQKQLEKDIKAKEEEILLLCQRYWI